MADFFETEEVVRGYDGKLAFRILSYIKSYKALIALSALALILATLGEISVPLLQQKIIDEAIVVRFHTLNLDTADNILSDEAAKTIELFKNHPRAMKAGKRLFVPLERSTRISANLDNELNQQGILDSGDWYAFTFTENSIAANIVAKHNTVFMFSEHEHTAAILKSNLYKLPLDEIAVIRSRDISFIIRTVILLLVILFFVFVFTFIQVWGTTLIAQRIMKDIRLELFTKTASQSTAFLSRHPVGRIVTRLTGDVETIDGFFSSVLAEFLKDLSLMTGVLITLFFLSPKLALAALATLPPVLVITLISRAKARDAFRKQRLASSSVNSYLSERLSGVQVVQLFRAEKRSLDQFTKRNNDLLKANLGEMYVFATFRPLVELFATISTSAIIVVGGSMILNLSLSLGVLIAFINLIGMFYAPVMDIAEKYTQLQSAMAGGERVFKLLDTDETIRNDPKQHLNTAAGKQSIRGHIEFRDVHFSYTTGEEILQGLSFSVKPAETVAIVGYTGAGKTTIMNVLTRLWDIDSGNILLDGIPIKELHLDDLRRSCLPVLQDVFLFSGTIADNIRLGLPLSDLEVENAAKAVHAHDFIASLPHGYSTLLAEGAANISSGQRQLISFARVIAHNPAVVILDEATSSIDTETELLIQAGIQKVLAGRTSIVIAHRLSTIRSADTILVLSGGRLIEQGRHDELIAQDGVYAGLFKLQYAES